jgi:exodeoxyribonuclease-3
MKLATWNVNGLKARLEFLKIWLAERAPDVVGLQELKLTDDSFPHADLEALGYRAAVHGQKGWNGVAVLSRRPLEPVQVGLPGQEAFGARLLTVCLEGELEFTTVYCPNGKTLGHDDYPAKLSWFDALAEHWATGSAARRVLCGDFNIVPAPLDSWRGEDGDGELFHTTAERDRLGRLLDLGLVDLYRAVHPTEITYSWWDYRGGAFHRKQGLRIDLVLGTEPVVADLLEAGTDREFRKKQQGLTASDHAPVVVTLNGP